MEQWEFVRRRTELMEMIGEGNIALVPTAPQVQRNRDISYPYRPDSYFYYLTGFSEPEALAVFIPGRRQGEYLLFCRESDPEAESWHGRRAGLEQARQRYGADDAFPIEDIDDIVPSLLENRQQLYYAMGTYPVFDSLVLEWLQILRQRTRSGIRPPLETINLDHVLNELRLFKSPSELAHINKAVQISIAGHRRAMRYCRPGIMEYQIAAEIQYECLKHGAQNAYPPIVGGGKNACILHYLDNDRQLKEGDLVLVDAGAEYQYYAADICRTYPVNGQFSEAQATLYNLVLDTQKAAIAQIKQGNHWDDPHQAAILTMTRGLLELGLLKGSLKQCLKDKSYQAFFMHRTGHWLGIDVHDVGDYKFDGDVWRLLEAGMTLTVEPGIYIAPDAPNVPDYWRGIGIRIEDDILITASGSKVLSAALPREIADIEALMQK